jgi:muconolactone delta-isomerase
MLNNRPRTLAAEIDAWKDENYRGRPEAATTLNEVELESLQFLYGEAVSRAQEHPSDDEGVINQALYAAEDLISTLARVFEGRKSIEDEWVDTEAQKIADKNVRRTYRLPEDASAEELENAIEQYRLARLGNMYHIPRTVERGSEEFTTLVDAAIQIRRDLSLEDDAGAYDIEKAIKLQNRKAEIRTQMQKEGCSEEMTIPAYRHIQLARAFSLADDAALTDILAAMKQRDRSTYRSLNVGDLENHLNQIEGGLWPAPMVWKAS